MDTNNVNPATVSPTKRPRIKDALATGLVSMTGSASKALDSGAEIINACAVRVKLHNISTAADILDEFGSDKVNAAADLIKTL